MTAGMLLWLFAAAVVSVGASQAITHAAAPPLWFWLPNLVVGGVVGWRIRRARQRKAQDVRNQQVQYLIDQNNKRRK